MKVAIVANPFVSIPPKGYGGIELVIDYLIRGLLELGHEPILLAPGDSKVGCPVLPICDTAQRFPDDHRRLPTFKKHMRQIERRANQLLKEIAPEIDVIHSHGFDLLKWRDFPHVFTIHNEIAFNPAGEVKDRLMSEFPFKPDTRKWFLKRKMLNYVSISNNQQFACPELNFIETVYNGEDPDAFPVVTKPQDYVCFLGRFEPEKNPHLAVELAVNTGQKIKIAGKLDSHGSEYFRTMIKPHLDNPLVEYLGELGFKEKVTLLKNAKCNLHPTSFREPFGLTVLEAAYCGTPTLAIARGSMPEIINNGVSGILVEDFLEATWQLDKCFKLDRQLIADQARRRFNYLKMTKGYLKAYKKAIRLAEREQRHAARLYTQPA